MRRMTVLLMLFCLLLTLVPWAQAQDVVFATDFDGDGGDIFVINADSDDIPFDILEEDGDSYIEIATRETAFLYLDDDYGLVDYSIEITARIERGLLWMTGRSSGDGCSGYDAFVAPSDSEVALYITNDDCDYDDELGFIEEDALQEGEWFTLRLEMVGEDLSLAFNERVLFNESDDTYAEGEPQFSFQPQNPDSKTAALIQISSIVVTDLSNGSKGGADEETAISFNPNDDQEDIIAALQAVDIVPSAGAFLFGEDYAYFFGQGSWFTALARRSPSRDIVIAGDLTFTFERTDEFQNCSLMAHVNTDANGTTTQQLEGGFDADGFAYIFDAADFEAEEFEFYSADAAIESGEEYHVLLSVFGGNASLFINGEPLLVREKVDDRTGTFGIGLIGTTVEAGCEGRDIWAWSFD